LWLLQLYFLETPSLDTKPIEALFFIFGGEFPSLQAMFFKADSSQPGKNNKVTIGKGKSKQPEGSLKR
jgi:hypothetical protein